MPPRPRVPTVTFYRRPRDQRGRFLPKPRGTLKGDLFFTQRWVGRAGYHPRFTVHRLNYYTKWPV